LTDLETIFPKKFIKAHQCNGFCQLCKIGHKIDKIFENYAEIAEPERKKSNKKKHHPPPQNHQQGNKKTVSTAGG
jgi:hypothetical protein